MMRKTWDDAEALLTGGPAVVALAYQRASKDQKKRSKSVRDQEKLNRERVARRSWTWGRSFTDNDRSASRYAQKPRDDYQNLISAISAGEGDVLVLDEISRGQRDLGVYVALRNLCDAEGLRFWLVGDRVYDLDSTDDRAALNLQALRAEAAADQIRDAVRRGMAGAAEEGLPHGPVTYGYRRVYSRRTRAFVRQEVDSELHTAIAPDGTESTYSHHGIVVELFHRVEAGEPLIAITRALNSRGVPSPTGKLWWRSVVRSIVMNPAYIGQRVFRGKVIGPGQWPAIVEEDQFWSVTRTLTAPERKTTRPGRAKWLLSYIIQCDRCEAPMNMQMINGYAGYRCTGTRRCTSVSRQVADDFVEAFIVEWLSRPAVYETLAAIHAKGDRAAAHARAEHSRLKAELAKWRTMASQLKVSAESFVAIEPGLIAAVADAERRMKEAAIPPLLRHLIGPDAHNMWSKLTVAAKRDVIRMVAIIRVIPVTAAPSWAVLDRVKIQTMTDRQDGTLG